MTNLEYPVIVATIFFRLLSFLNLGSDLIRQYHWQILKKKLLEITICKELFKLLNEQLIGGFD